MILYVISDLVSSEVQHYLLFRESEKEFWEDGIMLSQLVAGGYKNAKRYATQCSKCEDGSSKTNWSKHRFGRITLLVVFDHSAPFWQHNTLDSGGIA